MNFRNYLILCLISAPLYLEGVDWGACMQRLRSHRFFTLEGREKRKDWQVAERAAHQHGLYDTHHQQDLVKKHSFTTQNPELFHLASLFAEAFFQYPVESWVIHKKNWEQIKHHLFSTSLENRFNGIQLQILLTPEVLESESTLADIQTHLDWIRKDFNDTVTILLLPTTSEESVSVSKGQDENA